MIYCKDLNPGNDIFIPITLQLDGMIHSIILTRAQVAQTFGSGIFFRLAAIWQQFKMERFHDF